MTNPVRTPHVLAMIVCDQVIIDVQTGKQSLIGSFSVINTAGFPLTYPSFSVYVALTEGMGETPLRLRLIDVDEGSPPVIDRNLKIRFADPQQICEMHSVFHNTTFRSPGEYRFQLYCGDTPLMERRLLVRQVQPRPRQNQSGDPPAAPEA